MAKNKYQVEIQVKYVQVPPDMLPAWKASVARLYELLEQKVLEDKLAEQKKVDEDRQGNMLWFDI